VQSLVAAQEADDCVSIQQIAPTTHRAAFSAPLWDSHERKRLYGEAVEYWRFRSERWKYVRNGATQARAASQPSHP
jgi:hypothetical protein